MSGAGQPKSVNLPEQAILKSFYANQLKLSLNIIVNYSFGECRLQAPIANRSNRD
jgi:hypothetical protein